MKKVCLKRSEIVDLQGHFEDVARVRPEQGESISKVQAFKWRSGRNHNKCEALCRQFDRELEAVTKPTPELLAYFKAQAETLAQFQKTDDKGNRLTNTDGSPDLDLSRSEEIGAAIEALKQQHPAAMEFVERREKLAEEHMAGEIEVEFLTVRFEDVPLGVSGVWLTAIAPMIEGAPVDEERE